QDWSLAARRPGATHQRVQQKAGFIDENDMAVATTGQSFDPRPIVLDPVLDRLLVTLLGAVLGLLRRKNPALPSAAECDPRDSSRASDRGSAARCADRSTSRWRSRRIGRLS